MKTRTEVLAHLAEVCFGYGNATDRKLRALKLMDRLRELEQAEDNFGVPLPPFQAGPTEPDAIRVIGRWRDEERQARIQKDASFFEDVAQALEYLKQEKQLPKLNANTPQGIVKRLAAFTTLRMIQNGKRLPFRDEVIRAVEYQMATNKFLVSPLTPIKAGSHNPATAVQDELGLLRMRRTKKELNWRRILTELWLLDFLPTR